jgi:DNA helicase-2/ATP-dependent DNA helicase PcrA
MSIPSSRWIIHWVLFVAGDDDQSIYSFRYASPSGIQNFLTGYPTAGQHSLSDCFRCTPIVLQAGQSLIDAFPGPNRIPKTHTSLYHDSNPPVQGISHYWRCRDGVSEARIIAESCRNLIEAGLEPRRILILLSKRKNLWPTIEAELVDADVPYEPPRSVGFLDTPLGRLILSIVRIVGNATDYVAHRELLGILPNLYPPCQQMESMHATGIF